MVASIQKGKNAILNGVYETENENIKLLLRHDGKLPSIEPP